jgi:diketogulonate reductase-like aldo/keto reductase
MLGFRTGQPLVNQIEINPFLYRRETIAYFEREGVKFEVGSGRKQQRRLIACRKASHPPTPTWNEPKHATGTVARPTVP